jgi:hypothetical protein
MGLRMYSFIDVMIDRLNYVRSVAPKSATFNPSWHLTAVGACSSAIAVHAASQLWLSFGRRYGHHTVKSLLSNVSVFVGVVPCLIGSLLILLVSLSGCSRGDVSISGTQCSGNLSCFLNQCVTDRGGQTSSVGLPTFQAYWTYQFRPNEDIILVTNQGFLGVQSLLRQAYGEPDASSGSYSAFAYPMESRQSVSYPPNQIGVALYVAGNSKQTIICIDGRYGSIASPPKPVPGVNGWAASQGTLAK